MELVTGEEMRRIDRRTIDDLGIKGVTLMDAAGRGVANGLLADYPDLKDSGVVVLCGKGNNGGDGLVAARHLAQHGIRVHVLLFCESEQVKGDAAHHLKLARKRGVEVREIPGTDAWTQARSVLEPPRLALDALLGTGVRGGVRGWIGLVIRDLTRSGCRVVSIDLPSGIDADRVEVEGVAVRAERTYALCRPKLPLVLDPGATFAGRVSVIPIGIPDKAVEAERTRLGWLDLITARRLLPPRPPTSHKGDFGHLLAIAGSRGKSGAAVLLARGALRAGVGLITVATPSSTQETIAVQQSEMMTEPLPEVADGVLSDVAVTTSRELLSTRDALAIGPGLGTLAETREAVVSIIAGCNAPMVIDADALNALAAAEAVFPLAKRTPLVLTPHPGEAARLLGCITEEVQESRMSSACKLARTTGGVVVLKGHQTLVADPDGRVSVNSSGNPGMASGGSGDVLTGIIGAFLSRGLTGWDAACLGVFVHGDAGDRAAERLGQDSLIASDIVERLPETLGAIRDADR